MESWISSSHCPRLKANHRPEDVRGLRDCVGSPRTIGWIGDYFLNTILRREARIRLLDIWRTWPY